MQNHKTEIIPPIITVIRISSAIQYSGNSTELLQGLTCNHVVILIIEVDVPFSMLLPPLLMTAELSWLVKISLNNRTNYEPLTQIPTSTILRRRKNVLSSSLLLYWQVYYSSVSKYVTRILNSREI